MQQPSLLTGFTWGAGGMLTAWMRLKYPHIIDGGIAGSAPIWVYLGEVSWQLLLAAAVSSC